MSPPWWQPLDQGRGRQLQSGFVEIKSVSDSGGVRITGAIWQLVVEVTDGAQALTIAEICRSWQKINQESVNESTTTFVCSAVAARNISIRSATVKRG